MDADSILVMTYQPSLTAIIVSPDTMDVMPGATVQFSATGFDQAGFAFEIAPEWSAAGGTIDAEGFYTAGNTTGFFDVTASDQTSGVSGSAVVHIVSPTGVAEEAQVPARFELRPIYPNPFSASATVAFELPGTMNVRLAVFDAMGRKVSVLADGILAGGEHELSLTAGALKSGLYFVELQAGEFRSMRAVTVFR